MSSECTVCFNANLDLTLRCGHTFHVGCIDEWVSDSLNATCPNCRDPIHGDEITQIAMRAIVNSLPDQNLENHSSHLNLQTPAPPSL